MLKKGLYAPFLRNSNETRSLFGGLKSATTISTEPMALLKPKKMWVMDKIFPKESLWEKLAASCIAYI